MLPTDLTLEQIEKLTGLERKVADAMVRQGIFDIGVFNQMVERVMKYHNYGFVSEQPKAS